MQSKTKVHNFKFRLALTIVLVLGGFVFPLLFVLAVLVGWSLIQDLRNPLQEVDAWFTRRWTATADDRDWITYFLPFCESPAETTFLEAMISAYGLKPNKGMLCGSDLALDLQVKVPPYRVDFLINRWLVVEIDGATYHSSPEAIERDKTRDEFMQGHGYSVLRIPASVVFSSPDEAVGRVGSFICRRQSIVPSARSVRPEENKRRLSLREILSTVNDATSEMSRAIDTRKAVETYTKGHADRFYAERLAIEKAMELAESEIRACLYMSQSKEHREMYLAAYEELQDILDNKAQYSEGKKATKLGEAIAIPPLPKAELHPDPNTNEAINRARQSIVAERDGFFAMVRSKLSNDERLKDLVREKLHELRCDECWQYIS